MKTIKAEHRESFILILNMTRPPASNGYLTAGQVSQILGIKPCTVWRWAERGKLQRVGRRNAEIRGTDYYSAYAVALFLLSSDIRQRRTSLQQLA